MKRLSDYAASLGLPFESGPDPEIESVSNNSKSPGAGSLFSAIPGAKRDGHDFIAEAVSNGAVAAIVSRDPGGLPAEFPLLKTRDPQLSWALACEAFFDRPAASLTLSGVTGTNGKTTTAFILRRLLEAGGVRCGLLSTVLYDDCGGRAKPADRTTPDAWELQSLLSKMRSNSCTHAVMEASSHGLHQRRTGSAKFKAAIFTNLTGDHLDYHLDMESYYQAKRLLFSNCLAEDGAAVVNLDDPYGARLHKELAQSLPPERLLGFSKSSPAAFCKIGVLKLSGSGTELELSFREGPCLRFKSSLIGEHNACNIAAAATAALSLGTPPDAIEKALAGPLAVPGRLEPFALPSGATAFVDYAHTDDALFRVLSALKPLCKGSLTTVFGCGGDRDASKRPRMGAVSSRLSDLTIVTSDNPRSEDPLEIIAQIRKGVQRDARLLEIPDRLEAIRKAVELSASGDIALIAGKGHEDYQEAKGRKTHFDDREALLGLGARAL